MDKIWIKMRKGAVVQGYPGVTVGVPFLCDARTASNVLAMGIAEKCEAPKPEPTKLEVREPDVEQRDPEFTVKIQPARGPSRRRSQ